LPDNTPRDAQADAQGAANGARLHSDYDGSSDVGSLSSAKADSRLPRKGVGSKVEGIPIAASGAEHTRAGRRPGGTVTSRLRELIQQLGEAIHESVIESEQIAGVVQDIRRHGFDVLLMLEATIGLNEVSSKDSSESDGGETTEDGTFTSNDLSFLRSLRISVEGDEGSDKDLE
jgi:hypothetical protein